LDTEEEKAVARSVAKPTLEFAAFIVAPRGLVAADGASR